MSEMFKGLPRIQYEGPKSKNPLAFKFYNPEEELGGRTLKGVLRFAVSWWHTFCAGGADMFGAPAWARRPWHSPDPLIQGRLSCEAAVEFMDKLSLEFFCYHDRDLFPDLGDPEKSARGLDEVVNALKVLMKQTGAKCLWGTANLFSHPRYMHGAATSPQPEIFALAAFQVKKALDVTKELGGEGYVFWGGREGYDTLLNTDLALEQDNLAAFLKLAVAYAQKIQFKGQFFIEPKPMEPTKHQYDSDAASCLAFLLKYDLVKHFKLNLEANHATLAGHSFEHDLAVARVNGLLGSIDANQGDLFNGWDTDHFPTDIHRATLALYEVVLNGGLAPGGFNFDAKIRRGSCELDDMFMGYIAGMDTIALAYKIAYRLHKSGELEDCRQKRYAGWKKGLGAKIKSGSLSLEQLAELALKAPEPKVPSGRQEMLEAVINRYLVGS